MVQDSIERETTIAAPVERVWALLTKAEHIGRWFADAGAEIDLRPGGALILRWAEHGTIQARVEIVEPHHRFAYRWLTRNEPNGAEPVTGNSTLVEFTLSPEGDRTRLRVHESGFASLDRSDAQRTERRAENVEGWTVKLGELAEYAQEVAV
jgi:uncharacterized protein YndB with AHSA1/START domain